MMDDEYGVLIYIQLLIKLFNCTMGRVAINLTAIVNHKVNQIGIELESHSYHNTCIGKGGAMVHKKLKIE